jgi:WD40 repeat protein
MFKGATNVLFSPAGDKLVAAISDGTIHVWNMDSGQEEKVITVTGNSSGLSSIAFSSSGEELITGSKDGTIKIYSFPAGNELLRSPGIASDFRAISFAPDGKTIAAGTVDSDVFLWDLSSGKINNTLSVSSTINGGGLLGTSSIAFSPDGQTLVITDVNLMLWDVLSGKLLRVFPGHTSVVTGAYFCGGNNTLISGGDKTIRFWDTGSGNEIKRYSRQNNSIAEIACTSDGKLLAFVGANPGTTPSNLVINMLDSLQEAYVYTRLWCKNKSGGFSSPIPGASSRGITAKKKRQPPQKH